MLEMSKLAVSLCMQNEGNKKKVIINRGYEFGTIDGVITKTSDLMRLIFTGLKNGTATKLIDTEETLMYELA